MLAFATRYVDVEERAPVNREVSRSQTDDSMKRRRSSPKKDTYVKRGNEYVPLSRIDEPLLQGESLYWFRKKAFGVSERFKKFGSVK